MYEVIRLLTALAANALAVTSHFSGMHTLSYRNHRGYHVKISGRSKVQEEDFLSLMVEECWLTQCLRSSLSRRKKTKLEETYPAATEAKLEQRMDT
jgi:hypothetical protein